MAWNDIFDLAVAFAQIVACVWLVYGAVLAASAARPISREPGRGARRARASVSAATPLHSGITKAQG